MPAARTTPSAAAGPVPPHPAAANAGAGAGLARGGVACGRWPPSRRSSSALAREPSAPASASGLDPEEGRRRGLREPDGRRVARRARHPIERLADAEPRTHRGARWPSTPRCRRWAGPACPGPCWRTRAIPLRRSRIGPAPGWSSRAPTTWTATASASRAKSSTRHRRHHRHARPVHSGQRARDERRRRRGLQGRDGGRRHAVEQATAPPSPCRGDRPPAYDAYLEWGQGAVSLASNPPEAERHLRRSLELDPNFALARALLCAADQQQGRVGGSGPGPSGDRGASRLQPGDARRTGLHSLPARAHRREPRGRLGGRLPKRSDSLPSPYAQIHVGGAEGRVSTTRGRRSRRWSQIRVEDMPGRNRRPGVVVPESACGAAPRTGRVQRKLRDGQARPAALPGRRAVLLAGSGRVVALGRIRRRRRCHRPLQKATLRSGSIGAALYHAARELAAHGHADAATSDGRARRRVVQTASTAPSRRLASARRTRTRCSQPATASRALAIRRDLMRAAPDNLGLPGRLRHAPRFVRRLPRRSAEDRRRAGEGRPAVPARPAPLRARPRAGRSRRR